MIDLNELRDKAYKTACEHGFHDENHSDKHLMGLVITELAEVVEADRKGRRADFEYFYLTKNDPTYFKPPFIYAFKEHIKGSIEEELADVVIRLLDYAGVKKIDLNRNIKDFQLEVEIAAEPMKRCFARLTEYLCFACANPINDIAIGSILDKEYYTYHLIVDMFAIAHNLDIDLLPFIELKMEYNQQREKKHGKKY